MKKLFSLCLIALAFIAVNAKAEEEKDKPEPKIIYRMKTNVSFDDAIIEGAGNNPEGVYVVTPPEKQFGSLLKLRPNFHRELMRDSLLLK